MRGSRSRRAGASRPPSILCFGLFERFGVQAVDLDLSLGVNARATVWSHCRFTRPDAARHAINARLELKPGAHLTYNETHYHGLSGLIEVIPHVTVTVGRRAVYLSDFALVQGRVGKRDIDYEVRVGEDGVAELTRKVFGHLTDEIRIRDEEAVDPIVLGMLR
jgi:hypothetical protein